MVERIVGGNVTILIYAEHTIPNLTDTLHGRFWRVTRDHWCSIRVHLIKVLMRNTLHKQ